MRWSLITAGKDPPELGGHDCRTSCVATPLAVARLFSNYAPFCPLSLSTSRMELSPIAGSKLLVETHVHLQILIRWCLDESFVPLVLVDFPCDVDGKAVPDFPTAPSPSFGSTFSTAPCFSGLNCRALGLKSLFVVHVHLQLFFRWDHDDEILHRSLGSCVLDSRNSCRSFAQTMPLSLPVF